MKDSIFRFKQFSVHNELSGLKVGTDGVLLGAAATIPQVCHNILDIGTGTGLIALMLAQRTQGAAASKSEMDSSLPHITGIDIDPEAFRESALNFSESPWASRLAPICCSLQDFELRSWDMIVSNPPFFENSLKAPDAQRSNARHTDTLSYRDIVSFASRALSSDGILSMILPSDLEMPLVRYAASFGLHPVRILSVRTTAAKAPKRMIIELTRREQCSPLRENLVMLSDGEYTDQFRELTSAFYL